jgi:hypothetical protein
MRGISGLAEDLLASEDGALFHGVSSDVVRFPSPYNGNELSLNNVLDVIQKYFF